MGDELKGARQRAAFLRQTLEDAQRALFYMPLYKGSPLHRQVEKALAGDDPFRVCQSMLEVLVALAEGEISEGQACALAGLDPVTLRDWKIGIVARVHERWKAWREVNPPEVPHG